MLMNCEECYTHHHTIVSTQNNAIIIAEGLLVCESFATCKNERAPKIRENKNYFFKICIIENFTLYGTCMSPTTLDISGAVSRTVIQKIYNYTYNVHTV